MNKFSHGIPIFTWGADFHMGCRFSHGVPIFTRGADFHTVAEITPKIAFSVNFTGNFAQIRLLPAGRPAECKSPRNGGLNPVTLAVALLVHRGSARIDPRIAS